MHSPPQLPTLSLFSYTLLGGDVGGGVGDGGVLVVAGGGIGGAAVLVVVVVVVVVEVVVVVVVVVVLFKDGVVVLVVAAVVVVSGGAVPLSASFIACQCNRWREFRPTNDLHSDDVAVHCLSELVLAGWVVSSCGGGGDGVDGHGGGDGVSGGGGGVDGGGGGGVTGVNGSTHVPLQLPSQLNDAALHHSVPLPHSKFTPYPQHPLDVPCGAEVVCAPPPPLSTLSVIGLNQTIPLPAITEPPRQIRTLPFSETTSPL